MTCRLRPSTDGRSQSRHLRSARPTRSALIIDRDKSRRHGKDTDVARTPSRHRLTGRCCPEVSEPAGSRASEPDGSRVWEPDGSRASDLDGSRVSESGRSRMAPGSREAPNVLHHGTGLNTVDGESISDMPEVIVFCLTKCFICPYP